MFDWKWKGGRTEDTRKNLKCLVNWGREPIYTRRAPCQHRSDDSQPCPAATVQKPGHKPATQDHLRKQVRIYCGHQPASPRLGLPACWATDPAPCWRASMTMGHPASPLLLMQSRSPHSSWRLSSSLHKSQESRDAMASPLAIKHLAMASCGTLSKALLTSRTCPTTHLFFPTFSASCNVEAFFK